MPINYFRSCFFSLINSTDSRNDNSNSLLNTYENADKSVLTFARYAKIILGSCCTCITYLISKTVVNYTSIVPCFEQAIAPSLCFEVRLSTIKLASF